MVVGGSQLRKVSMTGSKLKCSIEVLCNQEKVKKIEEESRKGDGMGMGWGLNGK